MNTKMFVSFAQFKFRHVFSLLDTTIMQTCINCGPSQFCQLPFKNLTNIDRVTCESTCANMSACRGAEHNNVTFECKLFQCSKPTQLYTTYHLYNATHRPSKLKEWPILPDDGPLKTYHRKTDNIEDGNIDG